MDRLKRKSGYDLVYLLSCEINGIVPDLDKVKRMNLIEIYEKSKQQMVSVTSGIAIEKAYKGNLPNEEINKRWKQEKVRAVCLFESRQLAKKAVLEFLEKNQIWYVELKGSYLSNLYPQKIMREMRDIDLFFDKAYRGQVHDWFIENGYAQKKISVVYHDVYDQPPYVSFEMHVSLFEEGKRDTWDRYYGQVEKKLIRYPKTSKRNFSDEDFYIYFISHTYDDYYKMGSGIRSLMDVYVFLKDKCKMLNWEYVEKELNELQLREFEKSFRELALKVFEKPFQYETQELTEAETKMLGYLLDSGVYGNEDNIVLTDLIILGGDKRSISFLTKCKYVINKIISNEKDRQESILGRCAWKYKILMPIYFLKRTIEFLIKDWKRTLRKAFVVITSKADGDIFK